MIASVLKGGLSSLCVPRRAIRKQNMPPIIRILATSADASQGACVSTYDDAMAKVTNMASKASMYNVNIASSFLFLLREADHQ